MEARWTLPQTPGGIIVGVSPETRSDRQEVVPVMGGCAMSGLGWLLMTLGMLGFWALVAVLAVALLRRPGRPGQQPRPGAEEILAERLARGEIEADEYRQRACSGTTGSCSNS
jgi:putative membrane protein